eukprot:s3150_g1.t1
MSAPKRSSSNFAAASKSLSASSFRTFSRFMSFTCFSIHAVPSMSAFKRSSSNSAAASTSPIAASFRTFSRFMSFTCFSIHAVPLMSAFKRSSSKLRRCIDISHCSIHACGVQYITTIFFKSSTGNQLLPARTRSPVASATFRTFSHFMSFTCFSIHAVQSSADKCSKSRFTKSSLRPRCVTPSSLHVSRRSATFSALRFCQS